jgi:hypothetical protein
LEKGLLEEKADDSDNQESDDEDFLPSSDDVDVVEESEEADKEAKVSNEVVYIIK